jgi:hypothetical protein
MSIFDTKLGARPTSPDSPHAPAHTPTKSGAEHQSAGAGMGGVSRSPLAQPGRPGARPTPLCPTVIDWSGLLEGARAPDDTSPAPITPAPQSNQTVQETLAAIDEALRQNSARVTRNGLFDLDG